MRKKDPGNSLAYSVGKFQHHRGMDDVKKGECPVDGPAGGTLNKSNPAGRLAGAH